MERQPTECVSDIHKHTNNRIYDRNIPSQVLQPYLEKYDYRVVGELNNVNYVHNYSLYIGNHTDLTDEQIINLTKVLNDV